MTTRTITQNGLSIFRYTNFKEVTKRVILSPSTQSPAAFCHRRCSVFISSFSSRHVDFTNPSYLSFHRSPSYLLARSRLHNPVTNLQHLFSTNPTDPKKYETTDKNPTDPKKDETTGKNSTDPNKDEKTEEQKMSIYQRFTMAYKQHGKVLLGVHLFTSAFWAGGCFYLVTSGVDVVGLLEWFGVNDYIVSKFKSSQLGNAAAAYLCYKLLTPARYTVTLGGTNLMIKYLQRQGKMPKPTERERLKDIVKDGRAELKTKRDQFKVKRNERKAKRKERKL